MKLTVEGTPKEIADFVLELQNRRAKSVDDLCVKSGVISGKPLPES